MKFRILTVLAVFIAVMACSGCAHHQYPGSYHQQGNGHAKFY